MRCSCESHGAVDRAPNPEAGIVCGPAPTVLRVSYSSVLRPATSSSGYRVGSSAASRLIGPTPNVSNNLVQALPDRWAHPALVVKANQFPAAGTIAALREKLRSYLLRGCVYVLLGAACMVLYTVFDPVRRQPNQNARACGLSMMMRRSNVRIHSCRTTSC